MILLKLVLLIDIRKNILTKIFFCTNLQALIKNKNMLKRLIVLFLLLFLYVNIFAQSDYPLQNRYSFVRYEKNVLQFPGDKSTFKALFSKFDTLMLYGTNKLVVLQLGASHTQADVFTAELRRRFQNMYPSLNVARGYVFPYNLIKTNSPYNYKAFHTGDWSVCRNVDRRKCVLGLTGIAATTRDNGATITIRLRDTRGEDFSFNYIKVLHSTDSISFLLSLIPDSLVVSTFTNRTLSYTEFYLKRSVKEITFKVKKTRLSEDHFTLYGIFLGSTFPGIVFHPIGINGASTSSYDKCQLFEKQLRAVEPDWIIIALGTNDGYTSSFSSEVFKRNFKKLIGKIRAVNRNVAITIVVPNDDYYKRRYPNPNTAKEERVIMQLAKEEGCSVWDMYEIMGGLNSSVLWLKNGLMQNDKIHFTHKGYVYLADLFFTAFVDSYGDFMNKK